MKLLFSFTVLVLPAMAGPLIIGTANTTNCLPFANCAGATVTLYQQVYSSGQFSGTIQFNEIAFFGSPLFLGVPLDSATYQISFSTTQKATGSLDSNPSQNPGPDSRLFGTFLVSGNTPAQLTFIGQPFTFDPSAGNLLVQIAVSNITATGDSGGFQAMSPGGSVTSRLLDFPVGGVSTDSLGLVTEFSEVPEAESFLLVLGGLILGSASGRRRNAAKQAR